MSGIRRTRTLRPGSLAGLHLAALVMLAPSPALAQAQAGAALPQAERAYDLSGLPDDLQAWRAAGFPTTRVEETLDALVPLLRSPDPVLRDEIAFEGISTILRRGDATPPMLRRLGAVLTAELAAPDPQGVARPFAILTLAEVARTDRIERYLGDAEYAELVVTASEYLTSVEDYRGFSPDVGWRHGVAHGADFALQLVLNPRTSDTQMEAIGHAVASQVAPSTPYVFGESGRLARPVLYMAVDGYVPSAGWEAWLQGIAEDTAQAGSAAEEGRVAALARRHNLRAFLMELYLTASSNEVAELKPLATASLATIRALRD